MQIDKRILISSIDQNIKCFTSRKLYVLDIRLCRQLHISFKKKIAKISRMRLMIKLIFKGIIPFAFVQHSFEIGLYYGIGRNKVFSIKLNTKQNLLETHFLPYVSKDVSYNILSCLWHPMSKGVWKMHQKHYVSSLNKIMNDLKS